jgi:hypothetical protein
MDSRSEEVRRNYEAFTRRLPELVKTHAGKFALMRSGEIVEFFDTARDAYVAGRTLYPDDDLFSVQEVVEGPVDLGFYSHALFERPV